MCARKSTRHRGSRSIRSFPLDGCQLTCPVAAGRDLLELLLPVRGAAACACRPDVAAAAERHGGHGPVERGLDDNHIKFFEEDREKRLRVSERKKRKREAKKWPLRKRGSAFELIQKKKKSPVFPSITLRCQLANIASGGAAPIGESGRGYEASKEEKGF